jgi:cell division septum initiation protein DivIVA
MPSLLAPSQLERKMNNHCQNEDGGVHVLTSGRLQAEAARSVAFLNAIESTVSHLVTNAQIATAMAKECHQIAESMSAAPIEAALDPEGRVCDLLRQAADGLSRVHARCSAKEQAARGDQGLSGEDGVADAYAGFLESISHWHDALEELRERIETMDALVSESGGATYADVDEMLSTIATRR